MNKLPFIMLWSLLLLLPEGDGLSQQKKKKLPGQYKRIHQVVFRMITRGDAKKAVELLKAYLDKHPKDAESHYMLTVAYTALKQREPAVKSMQAAVKLGLPAGRFVGGTLTGLESIQDDDAFKKLRGQVKNQPVHGPMLGCMTDQSAKVWLRTAGDAKVQVAVSESSDWKGMKKSPVVRTSKETDYTAVIPITALKPNTPYYYGVLVNGQANAKPGKAYQFHTFAKPGAKTKLRVAFGGGAGFVPQNERMWSTIGKSKPDALLLLGDNVYIDDPKNPGMQHYCYYRRQSRPEYHQLTAATPVYAIWDDHDFGTNDCSGGPLIDNPEWKRPVWNVFRHNWVNPYYGGGEKQPGCYYDFTIGDIHFIMIDGRFYRTRSKKEKSTMIGPVQKEWLLDKLKSSKGTIKVLCSPVPWTFFAKGKSPDTWNGFQAERNDIFDFLAKHKIEGVVLMSADRHRSDLWKIERKEGYPLYEFNSSRLTNQAAHGTMKMAEFSYNKKQSFGLVDFDTMVDDPTVTYRIMTIDGEEVFKFTVPLSRLK